MRRTTIPASLRAINAHVAAAAGPDAAEVLAAGGERQRRTEGDEMSDETKRLDIEAIEEAYPVAYPVACHACGDTVETCDGIYYDHGACDASGKDVPANVKRRAPPHVAALARERSAEVDRLMRELAQARAALREYAENCDRCHERTATRSAPMADGRGRVSGWMLICDEAACARGIRSPSDLPHAAALRAAKVPT